MKVKKQRAREKRKENQMRKKIRHNNYIKRGGRNEDERKAEEPSC